MRSRAACAVGPGYGGDGAPMNMPDPALAPWALELGNPATRQAEDIKSHLQAIWKP